MTQFETTLFWERTTPDFDYETFSRDHTWTVKDGLVIPASSSTHFFGSSEHCDPEEALISALSSCHMLTFLAIAAKKRWTVDSYTDHPTGRLEPNVDGHNHLSHITLCPQISFSGDNQPSEAAIQSVHEKSHRHCFIANSIVATVEIVSQKAS